MKKSAIAVAVAAVLAAPVALADVQISGQLQAQLVSIGGDGLVDGTDRFGAARKGMYLSDGGMNGSVNGGNWGAINFVASEDLGDGMKALAKYTFNVTTGNFGGNTREAYVGLAGGFGAVLAGRLNHPYKTSTIGWDPFVGTFMQARDNAGMALGLHGSEIDNAIAYAGTFGAVKVVAAIVLDEGNDYGATPDSSKTSGKNAFAFSVNAPVGPVEVAVAYIDLSKHTMLSDGAVGSGAYDAVANATATKVGVKWTSGDLTVAGQYEMLGKGFSAADADIPVVDRVREGKDSSSVMYVTGSYKMGNNTISAAYGVTDKKANAYHEDLAGGQKNATYMAIGLNHAMSKNTSAFVGYRATDWGNRVVSGADKKNTETAIGAGLRVKF